MYYTIEKEPMDFSDIMHDKGIKRWSDYLESKKGQMVKDPNGKVWMYRAGPCKWFEYRFAWEQTEGMTTNELAVHCYDEE